VAEGRSRPAWAEIDLGALRHNVGLVARLVAPSALCAVVKADAYGHGGPCVAAAALGSGAAGLAVALIDEAVEIREAEVGGPILLLSEPPPDAAEAAVAAGLTPTLCTLEGVASLARAARAAGEVVAVHVKVDTGMHRMGAEPALVPAMVAAVAEQPSLRLEGLWTHLAVADGAGAEDRAFTASQLDRFDEVTADLAGAGAPPVVRHAANSAGAIAWPRARYDAVRCGLALYGALPSAVVGDALAAAAPGQSLRPVLSFKARVAAVRELPAGARPSYGRLRPLPERSVVATVPVGYADGVPRALFASGFEVLIGGRRRPLAGMVTMDQIVVDCGPGGRVAPGDEVVLLGRQGSEVITADEWAVHLGTISYEVLTGIGPRVPRIVGGHDGGAPRRP